MNRSHRWSRLLPVPEQGRRGSFLVIGVFCIVAAMGFVAFTVDLGYISVTRTSMQNAVDAAALAGALEITHAVQNAGPNVTDVTAYAMQQARLKAAEIAELNGVFVDPDADVEFGLRSQDPVTKAYSTEWGRTPANTVRVWARRTGSDTSEPNGELPLFFAPVFGKESTQLTTSATAYVEARDIVAVLDYSASMNDDSTYPLMAARGQTQLEANLLEGWNTLDGLRDFGSLQFEPAWASQTSSSSGKSGTCQFKNTQVGISGLSHDMNRVTLTYSDNTTENITASGKSGSFQRTTTPLKRVSGVSVRIQETTNGTTQTDDGSNNGRVANVTFQHPSIRSATNYDMTSIRLTYEDGTTSTTTISSSPRRDRTITGNGKYVSSVRVTMGSYSVTIGNPNGSTKPVTTTNLTFSDTTSMVKTHFGLNSVSWPYSHGSWDEFISHCRSDSSIATAGYAYKYGGKQMMDYLFRNCPNYAQCNDLWRVPHYPFTSVKQGTTLLADFVQDLGFGDELGLACYADSAVTESTLNYDGYNINLSSNPICSDFDSIRQIIRHRQAGHYTNNTNIGGGLAQGKTILDASKRPGTRPTIVLMTDGLANKYSSYTTPSGWSFDTLFDYDGDGHSNYTTSDNSAMYTLIQAKAAVDAGYTIHCLTVGTGADQNLMTAIAWLGRGIYIHVPGDQSVAEMQSDVLAAFNKIAAYVPPAKLVNDSN
jgi:hypothetical protein